VVTAPALLDARDVRKLYGDFCALDGVSLSVGAGEFVSIIGPNGAGKSTLINVLTGVLAPSGGHVRFKGQDIGGIGPLALTRLGMARSFQLVQIFPDLTVLETLQAAVVSRRGHGLRLFASLRSARQTEAEALEVAGLFGLAERAHRRARELPQGDKKLLDVASAFALRPEIILLEEPTTGGNRAHAHVVDPVMGRTRYPPCSQCPPSTSSPSTATSCARSRWRSASGRSSAWWDATGPARPRPCAPSWATCAHASAGSCSATRRSRAVRPTRSPGAGSDSHRRTAGSSRTSRWRRTSRSPRGRDPAAAPRPSASSARTMSSPCCAATDTARGPR